MADLEYLGQIRHDNTPDKRWDHVATYPQHFHDRKYENVVASYISPKPENALREFLSFAREKFTRFPKP